MLTNDSLAALRDHRRGTARPRSRRGGRPALPGRWSAVLRPGQPDAPLLWAQALLDRYGVVDRTAVANERVPGGFHGLFGVLRRLDDAGKCQQVYAVEGLGGAQFATAQALEQLRRVRAAEPVLLAATDPANPLGVSVPWPEVTGGRPLRKAGALVFLAGHGPLFYLDAGARSLLVWPGTTPEQTAGFVTALRERRSRVGLRRINGEEAFGSGLRDLLVDAGLRLTPSGLR
jgi:ATP-dependent Lhr-like helicase